MRSAVEQLKGEVAGAAVDGVASDLSDAPGCAALIAARPDVEILVNNLGVFEPQPFDQISDEDWFRVFETNVMSGVRLSRHSLQSSPPTAASTSPLSSGNFSRPHGRPRFSSGSRRPTKSGR